MSARPAPIFEALIVPHRSLTRGGGAIVVGILAAISAGVVLRLWLWGAWPAAIFSLLDVPLLLVLLMINWRRARASELIMMTDHQLIVISTDPAGRRQQMCLPTAWLRVDLQAAEAVPHIVLTSQGKTWEVGAFLHDLDKRSLFDALRDALERARNPRFDNPQLREG
ncbi:MAG TPA: hypothetical protein DDZ81_25575 [Acetobacteraceae bacterium]|jgi:uncharacterized membrane protein|nr:hypothetical protein [Acetobacteraceae bacterium]